MIRRTGIVCAFALLLASGAAARERGTSIRDLYHQAWGVREGAPGAVTSIAQTTDGYLWLATPGGLYRFDGVRFERMPPPSGAPFQRVVRVWAFADGSLWLHHDRGALTRLLNGVRTTFTSRDRAPDAPELELVMETNGSVLAATATGLSRLNGQRWEPVTEAGPGHAEPAGHAALVDRRGRLWVSAGARLTRSAVDGSTPTTLDLDTGLTQLVEAPDGGVWGITSQGRTVRALASPADEPRSFSDPRLVGRAMVFDARGTVWVAHSQEGLARVRVDAASSTTTGVIERFTTRDGLTRDQVFALFLDREQNIWVGTAGGLDLFRETALTYASGLPLMHAARFTKSGSDVFVGAMTHPLLRVSGGQVHATNVPTRVTALTADAAGAVWAWASGALWHSTDRQSFVKVQPPPLQGDEIWSLASDRVHRLWAVAPRSGVYVRDRGRWSRPAIPTLPATEGPIGIAIADRTARIWLGYETGTLATVEDGDQVRTFGAADGLRVGALLALEEDDVRTWVAGREGLAGIANGRVHAIAGLNSQTVGTIRGLARDRDGNLWLNADRGVVRLSAAEIQRAFDDPTVVPRYRVFDYLDGMVGGATPRPPRSALAVGNGQIWFVGFDGILTVDPARLADASAPPPVRVTTIRSAERDFAATDGLRMPVGTRHLQIRYTGLSLTMPDRVHFRYRLEGVDPGWQDAGTRRDATYTNLRPGHYRFHVMASSDNGVWNESGASTTFVLPPSMHQTVAFRIGVALAVLGAVWAAFRLRVRQVWHEMQVRLDARVGERERIARELHDTLLQGVQGLILRFQAIASRLPADDPTARLMEDALTRADDVIDEGRARVRDLRRSSEAAGDLAASLGRAGDQLVDAAGIDFAAKTDGTPRPLHPIVRDEAFWIMREAIANACRHSQARRLEVEVSYTTDELRVRCRDDGRGIEPALLASGRPGHFGLRGMRERAGKAGGQLDVRSRAGVGTEVELRVPGPLAYADARPYLWPWLRRLGRQSLAP